MKVYLPLAIVASLVATTGADVLARTSVRNEPLAIAVREHFSMTGTEIVGAILLMAPFLAVGFLCAGFEKRARSRSVAVIFAIATVALLYCYFQNHFAAQHALQEEMWTAAGLAIGLLPFFIGLPVVFVVVFAGWVAAHFDRRAPGIL